MPSTDIDGSPIVILTLMEARLVLSWSRTLGTEWYDDLGITRKLKKFVEECDAGSRL